MTRASLNRLKWRRRYRDAPKERQERIYATTTGVVSRIDVSYDPRSDEMRFDTPVEGTYFETSYDRRKGPKVVNRIPLKGPDLPFGASEALLRDYDVLVALDTNTRHLHGRKISMTGAILGKIVLTSDGARAVVRYCPLCVEMVEIDSQEERLGWIEGIRALFSEGHIAQVQKIGLIVDAHLSELEAMNARKLAVFRNVFLPQNITLIYASSDTGAEYLPNTLIRGADRSADLALTALEMGKAPPNTEILHGAPFRSRRIIVPR